MILINICVLKSGGEYTADHVQWLAKQVDDLHCLSDIPIDGVKTIPLQYDWPGWWSKMELFRPDICHDLFYYDLDTVVIDPIVPNGECSLMLRDFYYPSRSGSGLMYIRHKDKSSVWDAWIVDPAGNQSYKPTAAHHGDQGFIQDFLPHRKWQEFHERDIMSYKAHVRKLGIKPRGIVCFHGHPRPWEARESWVPQIIVGK